MKSVISQSEAFGLLIEALPDAQSDWKEHQREWDGEDAPYSGMAVFARHLVELSEQRKTAEFSEAFELIERLIVEGDSDVRDIVVLGLIESLQNIASWTEGGAEVFVPCLGPNSRAAWYELETIWAGKSSLADVIRAENRRQDG